MQADYTRQAGSFHLLNPSQLAAHLSEIWNLVIKIGKLPNATDRMIAT